MGRDLKGRKCGKGISQRKDKKVYGTFLREEWKAPRKALRHAA